MTKQPASCSLRKVLRLSAVDGREPGMGISVVLQQAKPAMAARLKKSAFPESVDQALSLSVTCAMYFSYSARVIRPPSRATRSWSRFDSEACTSSTRFHAASGACDPGCGTYSDSATLR